MSSFIQLNDINGVERFVNIQHIAYIESEGSATRIVMAMPGRDNYLNFAFLVTQDYATVQRLIIDSNE